MDKTLALFFHDQCAGTTAGQMAMVPNNPVLFSLIKAHTQLRSNVEAATKAEFAEFLRETADILGKLP